MHACSSPKKYDRYLFILHFRNIYSGGGGGGLKLGLGGIGL